MQGELIKIDGDKPKNTVADELYLKILSLLKVNST